MKKRAIHPRPKKTPVERLFRQIMGREMTRNERRVLLGKNNKARKGK